MPDAPRAAGPGTCTIIGMTGHGQYEHVFAPLRGARAWGVRVPDWDLDEDEFAVGDYRSHFLGDDSQLAAVTQVRYALNNQSDRAAGTVRAAEIRFQYGGVLFLDPMYYWGIRLQGAGAYERWLAEEREDVLEERIWTP